MDPVNGSVGLLWSGNWAECQAAVDAVLKGSPIMQMPSSSDLPAPHLISPIKTYDIRHVSRDPSSAELNKVKNRARFKRSVTRPNTQAETMPWVNPGELSFEPIRDPSLSRLGNGDGCKDDESMFSAETVEGSLLKRDDPDRAFKFNRQTDDSDVGLELTLGLVSV